MVVRTQSSGRGATGLYIGTRNARRHFKRHLRAIELQLGHLHIHCELPPDFWRGHPEIRDQRLSDWLESRVFHGRSCRAPVPMMMIPAEKNSFKLHSFLLPPVSAHGLVKIGSASAPARKTVAKTNCGPAPCRTRNFIGCSQNASR